MMTTSTPGKQWKQVSAEVVLGWFRPVAGGVRSSISGVCRAYCELQQLQQLCSATACDDRRIRSCVLANQTAGSR